MPRYPKGEGGGGVTATIEWIVSNTQQAISAAAEHMAVAAYVKMKEIRIDEDVPLIRTKFDFRKEFVNYSYDVHARLYLNGAPLGTERAKSDQSYTTYTQDFSAGYVAGDLFQLYLKDDGAYDYAQCRNFGLYVSFSVTDIDSKDLVAPLETTRVLACTVLS